MECLNPVSHSPSFLTISDGLRPSLSVDQGIGKLPGGRLDLVRNDAKVLPVVGDLDLASEVAARGRRVGDRLVLG